MIMLMNELHQGGINALIDYDNTIFDNFAIPEIFSTPNKYLPEYPEISIITKDDIINDIIWRFGDTPLFKPEPIIMKFEIGVWSRRRRFVWARMYKNLILDYEPIHNYDRHEEINHVDKNNVDNSNTINNVGKNTTENSGNDATTNTVSAENVSTWANDNKSQTDYNSKEVGNSTDETKSKGNTKSDGTHSENNHIYGNIGVTTSQQMLESDIVLLKKFDLVRTISNEFCEEFCLGVW